MARIANCEFQDNGCDDPRCKKTFCVLQKEEDDRLAANAAREEARVRQRALDIAKRILEQKGDSKPYQGQAEKLAEQARVIELARKQLADEDAVLGRPISN
jgi:hypothetical protein